jgi:hypothetical protein
MSRLNLDVPHLRGPTSYAHTLDNRFYNRKKPPGSNLPAQTPAAHQLRQ